MRPIVNALRLRRRVLGAAALVCALIALTLAVGLPGGATVSASGQPELQEDSFQTDDAVPATNVLMFGASPGEAPAETWGVGRAAGTQSYVIVRYAAGGGWTLAPAILNGAGEPLSGFKPAESVLAGQVAPNGAGALVGFVEKAKVILVRSPGQPFQETSPEPVPEEGEEALLHNGEELFASRSAPLMAALEEGSSAGALVVPAGAGEVTGVAPAVLHWEGQAHRWTREPIEVPAAAAKEGGFQALALAGSSPTNAWLLARVSAGANGVSLFRRTPGSGGSPASWAPVSPANGQEAGAPLTVAGEPVKLEAESAGQPLTVTEQGVWVDGERAPSTSLTLFFKPTGADEGEVAASWCNAQSGEGCTHSLPEELPAGEYRSFAWAGSSEFGERVITGFPGGVVLRLQGDEFTRLVTLGSPEAPEDVGASKGAAFSNALEGWLGNNELPVHATLEPAPEALLSSYWPVPFDKPLLAIAAQPGAPVGALSSQALAVGERGEVARYIPGEGWQPESLFEVAGQRAEPQLRAVAWPTGNRAYAVGVNSSGVGEMWLWRGETGLWEPDPATPVDFRADLLGIAFAPGQPSRGYAVGQGGALLRYGKTWTQEASCQAGVSQPCLPPEVAAASFTSVAFAGSEALVAYRVPHVEDGGISYTGGVLANNGSGWRLDSEVSVALGAGSLPWAVAGLPDGGAALSAANPEGQEPVVLERNSPGGAWEPTPVPYPGFYAPASLALFREGGALRVLGSGAIPDTVQVDSVTPPPAGFPPNLLEAYPLGLGTGVLRQTATAWSDEEPERRLLRPPPGGYLHWDIPYSPDPTAAILLDETGTSGWSVGGLRQSREEAADTADIARYPADGSVPPGIGASAVQLESEAKPGTSIALAGGGGDAATFALGGGAQCAAPCANLANARLGPDVWLSSALEKAGQIEGVREFLYTGPRVTTGATIGRATLTIPYAHEFERYAALLRAGAGAKPLHVAASSTDRVQGSACVFERELAPFGEFPQESCEAAQSAYYAFTSPGPPPVRVVMLDDSGEVASTQLEWLARELENASRREEPAIVVGSANLNEDLAKHEAWAEQVEGVLVKDGASAYLFDDPEKNVTLSLGSGPASIPAFGSGTLGYVSAVSAEQQDFIGASGFLLIVVEASKREPSNRAPVIARLVPDVGELSLDAQGGTLLQRSHSAMFSALARRPRAGGLGSESSSVNESTDFIPIPSNCQGVDCKEGIAPEYTFNSSNPKIGNFVEPNLRSGEVDAVELEHEEPIPDPKSGLFCAYNPGTTIVTISAGGRYASLPVTVQAGSVRRPCGTTPLNESPVKGHERAVAAPVAPAGPAPTNSPTSTPIVPVPLAPAPPLVTPPPAHRLPVPPQFVPPPLVPALFPAVIVPPPLPPVAEPTPPSGTSAVTSPVEAAQREEEDEEATESVSAQAVAYRQAEQEPAPVYLLGLMVLAAFAGATIRWRPRRGEREIRVAPATLSAMRTQRRMRSRHPW